MGKTEFEAEIEKMEQQHRKLWIDMGVRPQTYDAYQKRFGEILAIYLDDPSVCVAQLNHLRGEFRQMIAIELGVADGTDEERT